MKMPRGRESNVSVVALLIPKAKEIQKDNGYLLLSKIITVTYGSSAHR